MPFSPGSDYWLDIPAGHYRVGLTRDEAHKLAAQSAAWQKKRGPEFSLHDAKLLGRAAELVTEAANPEWIERYLLAHYPAREVELRGFAIARRPLTNREYRAFMADTGETQTPQAWRRGRSQSQGRCAGAGPVLVAGRCARALGRSTVAVRG